MPEGFAQFEKAGNPASLSRTDSGALE